MFDIFIIMDIDIVISHLILLSYFHIQHPHKRDARHNIMSPITIGAFTCMAVIAVSGFVMAIIKYKREHRDVTNKETQSP